MAGSSLCRACPSRPSSRPGTVGSSPIWLNPCTIRSRGRSENASRLGLVSRTDIVEHHSQKKSRAERQERVKICHRPDSGGVDTARTIAIWHALQLICTRRGGSNGRSVLRLDLRRGAGGGTTSHSRSIGGRERLANKASYTLPFQGTRRRSRARIASSNT